MVCRFENDQNFIGTAEELAQFFVNSMIQWGDFPLSNILTSQTILSECARMWQIVYRMRQMDVNSGVYKFAHFKLQSVYVTYYSKQYSL